MGTDIISIYIFLQFFENLPVSLDESAIMDGCTYFGVYFKILFPLLKPAIVTSMVLKGVGVYNEYYMSNLYLQSKELKTISTALYTFTGPYGNQYNYICAGVIITIRKARFHYVNGGIGGTSSHYGAARAVGDLLMYQPDVVILDFSVNDEADSFFQETFEGLLRKILKWPSRPAVLVLNNVFYETGKNAQEYHNAVARRYGVPWVSIRDTVYERIRREGGSFADITPDGLHPNDDGHGLVAGEIIEFLEKIRKTAGETKALPDRGEWRVPWEQPFPRPQERILPAPMTANAYENAVRLTIRECCPYLAGFRADTGEKAGHLDAFKNGWIGARPGDRIFFELEASEIAVQYRKTIRRPAACARLILDGQKNRPVYLDGSFEEDWGDCQYLQPVLYHGERKKHTVELEILPWNGERVTPFYLMGLVTA